MMNDSGNHSTKWMIEKFADDAAVKANTPYEVSVINGNVLLNAGIDLIWDLASGAGGTAYSNANAYIGVGKSSTGEDPTQTGLQEVTDKLYVAMEGGFPTSTTQTITFKSSFGTSQANWAWNEFSVRNASSEAGGVALNRKVSAQGTKTAGQTWVISISITLA